MSSLAFRGSGSAAGTATADASITLPGGTVQDDIVVVAAMSSNTSDFDMTMVTTGYDPEDFETYQNDNSDCNFAVWHKVQGATPDSTAVFSTNTPNVVGVACCHVWDGVDTATPYDVAIVASGATDGGTPDPDSATPVTRGAVAIAIGASSEADAVSNVPAGGYENLIDRQGTAMNIMMASKSGLIDGVAEDPGSFADIAGNAQDSRGQATVILRPAVPDVAPQGMPWVLPIISGANSLVGGGGLAS